MNYKRIIEQRITKRLTMFVSIDTIIGIAIHPGWTSGAYYLCIIFPFIEIDFELKK